MGCAPPTNDRAVAPPDLPEVATGKFLPAVRQEVEKAYDVARSRPKDPESNGHLGMVLHAHGQFEAAAACYRRAIALDPSAFKWVYCLAKAQDSLGKNDDAAESLRQALRLKPGDLPAQVKLAENLLSSGKNSEAEPVLRALLRDYPDSAAAAVASYGLGRIAQQKDPAAAAESLNRAIQLFPAYGSAHYALGLVYRTLGDPAKSKNHLELAERYKNAVPPVSDPLSQQISDLAAGGTEHIRLGGDLERAGKLPEAAAENEKAIEADPRLVQAHINLISLYGRMQQADKAATHYREAIRLDPNSAEAYYNYGVLEFGLNKRTEAAAAFGKALEINPFYADAHNNLGYLLEQRGRVEEAIGHYRKAIANNPGYRLAHFHLGRVLTNRRQYQEAIQHFQKTLQPEDENTAGFMYGLAAAYARSGDRASGLRYAREALRLAASQGQTGLAASIERDIKVMGGTAK